MKPSKELVALAEAVKARRRELGLTQKAVVARSKENGGAGLSEQTLRFIEQAKPSDRRVGTKHGLCWALRWTDDSVDRVLAGGEPVERRASDLVKPAAADDPPANGHGIERHRLTRRWASINRALDELKDSLGELGEDLGVFGH
jgi:hypothetical protein